MKFLLIGSGAREHALAWKLKKSKFVNELFLWPANPASAPLGTNLESNGSHLDILKTAKRHGINAIVVGPEQPLAQGFADQALKHDIPVFGPRQLAAQLESSKAFAKQIMKEAAIPTADFSLANDQNTCRQQAQLLLERDGGVVLKADGLAGGKGVFVCHSPDEMETALDKLFGGQFETAANQVLIETELKGRECSFFCFAGKGPPISLGFAVDFKRLSDHDQGPNTGGMGCYTPVPWLPQNAEDQVLTQIVNPLFNKLIEKNIPYAGCLYVGLMWTDTGPQVVEFNVRLGDPEAQILAINDPRDWGELIGLKLGIIDHSSTAIPNLKEHKSVAVGVVMASKDYPYSSEPDHGSLPKDAFSQKTDAIVFGAALKASDDPQLFRTGGGRVLTACATGKTFDQARNTVYHLVEELNGYWPSSQYRKDIAALATATKGATP